MAAEQLFGCPLCGKNFREAAIALHASTCDPVADAQNDEDMRLALELSKELSSGLPEAPSRGQKRPHEDDGVAEEPSAKRPVLDISKKLPIDVDAIATTTTTTSTSAAASAPPSVTVQRGGADSPTARSYIRLLTYNVWFGDQENETRMRAIGRTVELEQPDFIAFQEVTPDLRLSLERQPWWSRYWASPSPPDNPYFALLLSRRQPVDMRRIPFKSSQMGRDVIVASVEQPIGDRRVRLTVATSHLESMWQYADERKRQLVAAFKLLSKETQGTDDAIFMGDMNLKAGECATEVRASGWVDMWPALMPPKDKGYTMDSTINTLIETKASTFRSRLDRIFTRTQALRPTVIRMVGTEAIKPGLWASDHFGLVADLVLM